ncbi:MAG: kelch repeat-containing protein [Myxococcaceae bacterium]
MRLVALLLLAGCVGGSHFGVPNSVSVAVAIRVQSCDPALDPFTGVKFLGARVSGQTETLTAVTGPVQSVTVIAPIATGLTVEVRGYDGDPAAGGKMLSRGVSAPFDTGVTDAGAVAPPVQVFLRKAGVFTPVFSVSNGGGCHQALLGARAAHTATLLKDGTVLLAGGFDFLGGGDRDALYTDEAFDPRIDAFVGRHELSIANGLQRLPRAHMSESELPSGQLLLWGGESYSASAPPAVSAIVLVYDGDSDNFGPLPTRANPPSILRSRHHSAVAANGLVVIAGGVTRDVNGNTVPAQEVEWFDPSNNTTAVANGVALPRDGSAVVALQGGDVIAVAGGSDGGAVVDSVTPLRWTGASFAQATPIQISARRDAAAATLQGKTLLLLAGGFSDPAATQAIGTTELVDPASGVSSAGPVIAARGEACAVTVGPNDVLIAGGRDASGASGAAELVHLELDGGMSVTALAPLTVPRYQHTCTLMSDGTVLIAGGLNGATALQDAYVFQPGL